MDLLLTERRVDLLDEGFHLAIRVADPRPGVDLIRKRLGAFTMIACAADAYLSAHGAPRTPVDMVRHTCLPQRGDAGQDTWRFERDGKTSSVEVRGPLRSNDVDALRLAALGGMGIALLPSYLAEADLRSGALRRVLRRYAGIQVDVYALYPERRHLPARVRALLDFLGGRLR
jgi:DNA-binding transcriptional LysR family regulator